MLASPKFSEFLGNIAPLDKKAMWMGFSQVPMTIGWTLEGKLGPWLYDLFSSKDGFAREMLKARGMAADLVAKIPNGEAFHRLVDFTHESPEKLTQLLYQSHNVGLTWFVFAAVGIASAVMIFYYGQWIRELAGRTRS